jgi:hypothetical protein
MDILSVRSDASIVWPVRIAVVTLAELVDRLAIQDLLVRYATAIDHDMRLWDEVFLPDAPLDYSRAGGAVVSAREMKHVMFDLHRTALSTQHLMSNMAIELSGDAARGRTAARLYIARPGTRPHLVEITDLSAYYDDEFVRTQDGWRISARNTTITWREYRTCYQSTDLGISFGAQADNR